MKEPLSICFVAPEALPALLASRDAGPARAGASRHGGLGGAELQQAMVGRELAQRGHRVTFVVRGRKEDPGRIPQDIDRIKMQFLGAAAGRAAEIRQLHHAMLQADSDIYTVRSNHLYAALAAGWCFLRNRRFVFAAGHDGNCDLALAHRRPHGLVALAYAAALRYARAVVVQGENQRSSMKSHFGVRSVIIPSAIDPDAPVTGRRRCGVLWVGTVEPRKGVDRLLEIASSCPGVEFTAAGGPGAQLRYHDECQQRAAGISNLSWLGPVPHERVLELFAEAALFLNTSRTEGFPNTFLEAWKMGTPVVSQQIDPDGCLRRHGIGVVSGDVEGTARVILELLGNPRRRDAMARDGRRYLESGHALHAVADMWEELLVQVAARKAPMDLRLRGTT